MGTQKNRLNEHPKQMLKLMDKTIFFVSVEGRVELLKINLKGVSIAPDVDLSEVAKKLDGYSGADITNVCR